MPTQQANDPTIDEIREVRHRISENVGHDPERLVAYYMRLQEQYRDRLIETVESEETATPSAA
jgi:hypothetical protein